LKAVEKVLESGKYAVPAQKALARLDKELAGLGYDAAAHDTARRTETEMREAEEQYRKLESAREVSRQIEGEISALQADIRAREAEIGEQQILDAAASALTAAEADAPNLEAAENELLRLREQENQVRDEAGAARQKVGVLTTLRGRKAEFGSRRQDLAREIARHKTLERAFGKDGVPALLIEQALPEIETKANELLDRLSDGQMSVRFLTQAEYKDKKRADLKETLDIRSAGQACDTDVPGEAFRVDLRSAGASSVLAQRKERAQTGDRWAGRRIRAGSAWSRQSTW
jgi:exonuclease SbcC